MKSLYNRKKLNSFIVITLTAALVLTSLFAIPPIAAGTGAEAGTETASDFVAYGTEPEATPAAPLSYQPANYPSPYPWSETLSPTSGDYIADSYGLTPNNHVFEDVTIERLEDVLTSAGDYYVLFGTPKNETAQKVLSEINAQAQADGITKIYHFSPILDNYYLDITSTDPAISNLGSPITSVNYANAPNAPVGATSLTHTIGNVWTYIKYFLPNDAQGDIIRAYKSENTLLFRIHKNNATDLASQAAISAIYQLTPGGISGFNSTTEKAKVHTVFGGGTIVAGNVRTNYDFFKRAYKDVLVQKNAITDAKYPGGAGFNVKYYSYPALFNLVNSPGEHAIFFGGFDCSNTKASFGWAAERAKVHNRTIYYSSGTLGGGVRFQYGDLYNERLASTSNAWINVRAGQRTSDVVPSDDIYTNVGHLYGALSSYFGDNFYTQDSSNVAIQLATSGSAVTAQSVFYYKDGYNAGTGTATKRPGSALTGPFDAPRYQYPFLFSYNKDYADPVSISTTAIQYGERAITSANATDGIAKTLPALTEYMLSIERLDAIWATGWEFGEPVPTYDIPGVSSAAQKKLHFDGLSDYDKILNPSYLAAVRDGTLTTYPVTFKPQGSEFTQTTESVVAYSTIDSAFSVPSRAGYTFDGWYSETESDKLLGGYNIVTQSLTLRAHWKVNVTIDLGGGTTTISPEEIGTTIGAITKPTKADSLFNGWTLNGSTPPDNTVINAPIILTANWIRDNAIDGEPVTGGLINNVISGIGVTPSLENGRGPNLRNVTTVGFGGKQWNVIGYYPKGGTYKGVVTSSAVRENSLTLLLAKGFSYPNGPFSSYEQDETTYNDYGSSALKTTLETIVSGLSAGEQSLILPRELKVEEYIDIAPYSDGISDNTLSPTSVTGAKFWPLSTQEATKVAYEVRAFSGSYYLRTPGHNPHYLGNVSAASSIGYSGSATWGTTEPHTSGVRPAFIQDLSKVIFTSAAVGGKSGSVSATLPTAPKIAGNANAPIKLTVLDSALNLSSIKPTATAGRTITLNYTGKNAAATLSAIVKSSDGTVKNYGKLSTSTAAAGSAKVTVPTNFNATGGDKLYVFAERINGDNFTDFAGTPILVNTSSINAAAAFAKSPVPVISGKINVGKTLTAKVGTWSPVPAFTYQWYASGKAIAGAKSATYKLTSASLGKKITVKVTGTKAGYQATTKTSAATAKVTAIFAKSPVPKISGTAKVGKKLKAKVGTWSPKPKFTYQWYAGGKAIKGATKATLKLKKAQKGKKITVKVTAKKTNYATKTKASKATAKVK